MTLCNNNSNNNYYYYCDISG